MNILVIILIFVLGVIFGSFFNVVGYRIPKGLSIVRPGSFCPKCHHDLKWYELIPIFSYLFLRGKCSYCHQKISPIYPIVELVTGLLFLIAYLLFGFSTNFLIAIITESLLMIVIVSDINYLVIPDEVTIFFCILIFIVKLVTSGIRTAGLALLSGLALFLLMYLIMQLGNFLFKKESLGGGDVKLMFFVGITIGPLLGIFCIFLSSIIALPLSLLVYLKDEGNVIPFGPFILLAALIIILFKIDVSMLLNIFA